MSINRTPSAAHAITHDIPFLEHSVDAYRMKGKLSEPTVCPQCGAVYHKGRWQWMQVPDDASETLCSACHRENDHYPAGYLTLSGPFFSGHSDEIMRLARHHEHREREEHPLQRIMAVERSGDSATITTTDVHLARGIAEAIHRAYQGKLEMNYSKHENLLRVKWEC